MKYSFCLMILMSSCMVQLYAQQNAKPLKPFRDSLINNEVIKLTPPVLTYKGNNNNFDIYTASPDNMYVIKPDSTMHFNMPTGNYKIIVNPFKKTGDKQFYLRNHPE